MALVTQGGMNRQQMKCQKHVTMMGKEVDRVTHLQIISLNDNTVQGCPDVFVNFNYQGLAM